MNHKLYILLSLIVIASMTLTACGGTPATEAAARTEAPAAEPPTSEPPTEAPATAPPAETCGAIVEFLRRH